MVARWIYSRSLYFFIVMVSAMAVMLMLEDLLHIALLTIMLFLWDNHILLYLMTRHMITFFEGWAHARHMAASQLTSHASIPRKGRYSSFRISWIRSVTPLILNTPNYMTSHIQIHLIIIQITSTAIKIAFWIRLWVTIAATREKPLLF